MLVGKGRCEPDEAAESATGQGSLQVDPCACLVFLNFDGARCWVGLFRKHRCVHFRRRLIVVNPALRKLLLQLLRYPVA